MALGSKYELNNHCVKRAGWNYVRFVREFKNKGKNNVYTVDKPKSWTSIFKMNC
jgi:hypothetical protein